MADKPKICSACHQPLIEGCRNEVPGGGGLLKVVKDNGEITSKMCPNVRKVRLKRYLEAIDPLLITSEHNRDSVLYQPGTAGSKSDYTSRNLLFQSTAWKTFLKDLKWVAGYKFPSFYFKVVTDMTLLNVYVGNTSIRQRLPSQREDPSLVVCNSLEDLLTEPDLVIIRLGHVTHFNKAAANVLHEALLLRLGLQKPVWLIEPTHKDFTPGMPGEFGATMGMPCCNEEVLALVKDFDQIQTPDGEEDEEDYDPEDSIMDEDTSLSEMAEPDHSVVEDEEDEEEGESGDPHKVSDDVLDDIIGPDRKKKRWTN